MAEGALMDLPLPELSIVGVGSRCGERCEWIGLWKPGFVCLAVFLMVTLMQRGSYADSTFCTIAVRLLLCTLVRS